MIKEKEVKHLAQLARLELAEQDLPKLEKDLASILDYVGQLKKVDASKVEGKGKWPEANQRPDEARPGLSVADELLSLAPSIQDRYIKVKSVFKHGS